MDTVSSLVSRHAPAVRPSPAMIVLALAALTLLVVLGAALAVVPPLPPADPLLGPFRWTLRVPVV